VGDAAHQGRSHGVLLCGLELDPERAWPEEPLSSTPGSPLAAVQSWSAAMNMSRTSMCLVRQLLGLLPCTFLGEDPLPVSLDGDQETGRFAKDQAYDGL
jgi:hypothetical protein